MILDVLIWIVTIGAFVVGVLGAIAPVPLSRLFGAPVGPGNAALFVRALGLRDVVLAIVLAFAILRGFTAGVSIALAVGALYAIGDFGLVISAPNRRFKVEHLCHVFGFVVCAVLAYLSMRR